MWQQKEEVKREIKKQMNEENLIFAGQDSMEDYFDVLDNSAEYVIEIYEDCITVPEKVDAWIDDTKTNFPEVFQTAETLAA